MKTWHLGVSEQRVLNPFVVKLKVQKKRKVCKRKEKYAKEKKTHLHIFIVFLYFKIYLNKKEKFSFFWLLFFLLNFGSIKIPIKTIDFSRKMCYNKL